MSPEQQLLRVLDQIFEGGSHEAHQAQLNSLLGDHPELIETYCDYMSLHASLYWDTGAGINSDPDKCIAQLADESVTPSAVNVRRPLFLIAGSVLSLSLLLIAGWQFLGNHSGPSSVVENEPSVTENPISDPVSKPLIAGNASAATEEGSSENRFNDKLKPLDTQVASPKTALDSNPVVANQTPAPQPAKAEPRFVTGFQDSDVVQTIDNLLQQSWKDSEVTPSQRADDSQWVRRAYLVYVGRIPSIQELQDFQAAPKKTRRASLIDRFTDHDEVPEYLADVWTRLMIGRINRPGVNRTKLQEYLVSQFAKDGRWIDTVTDLITARGRNDQNGATNFLLAHLNNQATPATAVTARLFLGQQISCVQCHDHPFAKGVQQQDYWALNAFFKDTQKVSVKIASVTNKNSMLDIPWKLEDRKHSPSSTNDPMTYFENRRGQNIAVLPTFDGQTLDHRSTENRRQALAKLLAADSKDTVARAMVNRMWAHFFGYGFTNPIDDMGPHIAVSHPELLDALAEAFIKSDYSLKRLMKWIALSEAWQKSSQQMESAVADSPEIGDVPLFSRVYARRMSPEQVYESIRVAIQSAGRQPLARRQEHAAHRRSWVRQFATAYETDENDESMDFEGTISQAMVMMNGAEINKAISAAAVAVQSKNGATTKALEWLAESLLTRSPTAVERKAFRRHVQQMNRRNSQSGSVRAVEDMLWAYLNSTEFMTVH